MTAESPLYLGHPAWAEAFPWLVQGTTTRGDPDDPFDLGLFGDRFPSGGVMRHWDALLSMTAMSRVVHARQLHGSHVRLHGAGPPGLDVVGECDGHLTGERGVLLTVATADCVPVFVVDARRKVVGAIHAGWRGAAAGVLEMAMSVLEREVGSVMADVHVHLGPAICGTCYEVGPEVFEALGQAVPEASTPIDLRAVFAERAIRGGVPSGQVSVSRHCTRCTDSGLFSHRGGDRQRQVGFIGIRR